MQLEFKEITADDISVMMPYYHMRKNRTCDSVFLESFIWKDYYHVQYAIWEERALVWLMELDGKYFSAMPLCREEDLGQAFLAIETYFNEVLGFPLVINLADEEAVKYLELSPEHYLVKEQEDSKDYLYSAEALRSLSGRKLHKKKNRLNAFLRQYEGRFEYRRLCCSDRDEIWKFLDRWRVQKGEEVEAHLESEVAGIHDILRNCSYLNTRMGGIYIDGVMEAFSVGSYNSLEEMAVIHIEKANPEINGLYQAINQMFLVNEFSEAVWVNREDDMGMEGLRRAKMSYNPIDFARKYLVQQISDKGAGYAWAEAISNTVGKSGMAYMKPEEKAGTQLLWRAAFSEDSQAFVDYYYKEKIQDNEILVKKENGLLVSMLHRNPYTVQWHGQSQTIDYIVAVATDVNHRRRGHMRDLLQLCLKDMYDEGMPFAFLMPAAADIYMPFDFRYVGKRLKCSLTKAGEGLAQVPMGEQYDLAAQFMQTWLGAHGQLYTVRDRVYVCRLAAELASENGRLDFLYDKDKLVGLKACWGLEKEEQRLLYSEEPWCTMIWDEPLMMARITHVEQLLKTFTRKSPAAEHALDSQTLELTVADPIIEGNSGTFLWTIGVKESLVFRKTEPMLLAAQIDGAGEKAGKLSATVGELTSWLLGGERPAQLWPDADASVLALLEDIDVIQQVLLDEVV